MVVRLSDDEARVDGRADDRRAGRAVRLEPRARGRGRVRHGRRADLPPDRRDPVARRPGRASTGLTLTVESTDGRRVGKVLVVRTPDGDEPRGRRGRRPLARRPSRTTSRVITQASANGIADLGVPGRLALAGVGRARTWRRHRRLAIERVPTVARPTSSTSRDRSSRMSRERSRARRRVVELRRDSLGERSSLGDGPEARLSRTRAHLGSRRGAILAAGSVRGGSTVAADRFAGVHSRRERCRCRRGSPTPASAPSATEL